MKPLPWDLPRTAKVFAEEPFSQGFAEKAVAKGITDEAGTMGIAEADESPPSPLTSGLDSAAGPSSSGPSSAGPSSAGPSSASPSSAGPSSAGPSSASPSSFAEQPFSKEGCKDVEEGQHDPWSAAAAVAAAHAPRGAACSGRAVLTIAKPTPCAGNQHAEKQLVLPRLQQPQPQLQLRLPRNTFCSHNTLCLDDNEWC
jgi:hypothetical protein